MKTILCYGDSNTWGADPSAKQRFGVDARWTGVLSGELGDDYRVVEEGLCGRTTVWDDPIEGYKNGETYLIPCLDTHMPIDLVVVMLGTNDLKVRFSLSAYDIAAGMEKLIKIILGSGAGIAGAPKVLLLSPPHVGELTDYSLMFAGAADKSKQLAEYYSDIAQANGCSFFDTASIIETSPIDGVHFEADAHKKLGTRLGQIIKGML